jgi:enoyl-CoA hydratase/carnithine racemase
MQFEIAGGVAQRPLFHVHDPVEWMALLAPVLDDRAAHVLCLDLTRTDWAEPGWDDRACRAWRLWRKPTICALDGWWSGDKLAFALACDIRVCAPDTEFRFSPGYRTALLESLVGTEGARELEAGYTMHAPEARARGLVFSVDADPAAEALRIASTIASRGPLAVQLAKEAVWRGLEMPLEQALRFETDLTLLLQTTKDRAEGVSAFLQKREPHFTGS